MARKLKGKATKELKGESKRTREKEYENAKELWIKFLPIIALILISFIGFLSYKMIS